MVQGLRGKRIAVTGAAGFIGSAVVERLEKGAFGEICDLRLNDIQAFEKSNTSVVVGSFADPEVRRELIGDGVDVLFHLASLPGGASERDPALGKRINLDGTIALIDSVAKSDSSLIIFTSTIAALGRHEGLVDDSTALRPAGSYGTHKAMVEYYLTDLTRRGVVDARSIRPAGIVARPKSAFAGFATAWMSDLFHAAREGRPITIPSRPDAHIWLQSIDAVATNVIHSAQIPATSLGAQRAWTLPTTVVRVSALVEALGRFTGHEMLVSYGDGPTDQPPLDASGALALGFVSDGDTDDLVKAVLSRMECK